MSKSNLGYYDLTEAEKRIYEGAYLNIMCEPEMEPLTKDQVHDLCMTIVDGFQYIIADSKPYNPAD